MDRIFKPPFYERRYIASAPSLSSTAELSKSCGLVGVLDGRVGGDAEIAGAHRAGRAARISEVQAFISGLFICFGSPLFSSMILFYTIQVYSNLASPFDLARDKLSR